MAKPLMDGRRFVQCIACLLLIAAGPNLGHGAEAYVFRGVEPGVTTTQALRANERWGAPQNEERNIDGSTRWFYQPQGYKQAIVTVRGDRVQAIDIFLPDGTTIPEAVEALKLGTVVPGANLSRLSKVGEPMPPEWEPIVYSAANAVLFVDRQRNAARALCTYTTADLNAGPISPFTTAAATPAQPASPASAAGRIVGQDERSREIMAGLAKVMPQNHISGHPVDEEIAQRTLASYLDQLDAFRMVLTRADVDLAGRNMDQFAEQLRRGDMSRFYELFRVYLERLTERAALAARLLDTPPDFLLEETYDTSPGRNNWLENDLEAREAWRKRIKHDLLTHLETGASDEEAKTRVSRTIRTTVERSQAIDDAELLSMAANAFATAYDPRGSYMTPREWQDVLRDLASQSVGIGASLQMLNGYPEVFKIFSSAPAGKDGRLREADRIVAVAQDAGPFVDVVGMRLNNVVDLIRGAEGTKVRLRALSKGSFEAKVIELTRGRYETQRIGSAVLNADAAGRTGDAKIGYLYLPTIYTDLAAKNAGRADYRSTARDMLKILSDLRARNVDVAVLDLRDNPGGTISEAVEVSGLFVGIGPVVMVRDGQGRVNTYEPQEKPTPWDRPLVVLTNKNTSGGGEIIAGAIQDYRRGIVIGEVTQGNGTVGQQTPLAELLFGKPAAGSTEQPNRLGVTRITGEKFYRAKGDGFQARGVSPDVPMPPITDLTAAARQPEPFALSFDTVPAAKFTAVAATPNLQSLVAASQQRRDKSEYFRQLNQRLQQLGEPTQRGVVSLNKEKFFAQKRQARSLDGNAPAVPGIPDVKLTPYLQETFAIALDYAVQQRSTRGTPAPSAPARRAAPRR